MTFDLRARYYNPSDGRFLSRDSYAYNYQNPFELNRYSYAANNPTTYFDPQGRFAFASNAVATSIIGGMAGAFAGGIAGFVTSGMILVLASLDICGSLGKWVYGLSQAERNEFIATSTLQGILVGGLAGAAIGFAGSFGLTAGLSVSGLIAIFGLAGALKQLASIPDSSGRACTAGAMVAGAAAGMAGGSWFYGNLPKGGWTGGPPPVGGIYAPADGPLIDVPAVVPNIHVPPAVGGVAGITGAVTTTTGTSSDRRGDNDEEEDVPKDSPEGNGYLYRGDTRRSEEIKEAGGFFPERPGSTGTPEEIVSHVDGGEHYGKYVSTSPYEEVAAGYGEPYIGQHNGYVYKFRNPGWGYSVREAFLKLLGRIPSKVQAEAEVQFGQEGIPLQYIEAYRLVNENGSYGNWVRFQD